MIHAVAMLSSSAAPPPQYSITFSDNPAGPWHSPTTVTVTITITGASNFRWNKNNGAWTYISGTSTQVSLSVNTTDKILYVDILDGSNNVLSSGQSNDYVTS